MPTLGDRLAAVRVPVLTPRLALRLPRVSDVPRLVEYLNDPPVFRPVFARSEPLTRSDELVWVQRARRRTLRHQKLNLAITQRSTGELIGGVGLELREEAGRRGWLGYWIARPFWHRGYASEAASAVLTLGFERVGLHRVDAAVFEFNPRSMRLLERLGFRREGYRREVLRRDGRWYDEATFGLLAREFRPAPAPRK
jgi:[ribosomal protein S5]-alanine N-acetyltransferase